MNAKNEISDFEEGRHDQGISLRIDDCNGPVTANKG
jgi:hypothetical protein